MFNTLLAPQPMLARSGRIRSLVDTGGRVRNVELGFLFLMGVVAAVAAHLVSFKLGIPGHAIIRVVFPIALGLALVPRRGAGLVMGTLATGTGLLIQVGGYSSAGLGATISLLLTGILFDVAASRARAGWQLYAGLAAAGFATNTVAFSVKALTKLWAIDPGAGLWYMWWPRAVVSYPLCGLAAGLICGIVFFRLRRSDSHQP